ncbi:uncharacterized protein LOC117171853 isoform X2 [Belonocnema kinseyi]|uniref:uncharacterized protein LOC117171853 isoform X2 n=1 Tax=Belonocnema kinseyi TaxID=2817044 RepID=UPI00143DD38F|nr:uncharacterized protein LOC117171853 isoform X2 [Belonocnema kinseyi]
MGCPFCLLLCCLLVIGHVQDSLQLKIKQVKIPETVQEGELDYVILDCDYDLEGTSAKLLVVKWFFKKEESPSEDFYVAYQWIHGRLPVAEPSFKKYIDIHYKASDDPFTMYRALKLNKPTVDVTGTYMCQISTVDDETQAQGSMVIYSAEKRFELITRRTTVEEKEGVEVTCVAEGLYPQPTLEFFVDGDLQEYSTKPDVTMKAGSPYYNILARIDLENEDLQELAILKCTLSISEANYNVSRESVYQPGNTANSRLFSLSLIIALVTTTML